MALDLVILILSLLLKMHHLGNQDSQQHNQKNNQRKSQSKLN